MSPERFFFFFFRGNDARYALVALAFQVPSELVNRITIIIITNRTISVSIADNRLRYEPCASGPNDFVDTRVTDYPGPDLGIWGPWTHP